MTLRMALRRTCHRTWRPSGPGRRAPSSPRHRRRRRLRAARAEMGAQLGSSVAFGSGLWASASFRLSAFFGGAAQSAFIYVDMLHVTLEG